MPRRCNFAPRITALANHHQSLTILQRTFMRLRAAAHILTAVLENPTRRTAMNISTFDSNHRFRSFAVVAALGVLGAGTAWAGASDSITVGISDLDLRTPAGVATLYERVQTAAKTVCGYKGGDVIETSFWNNCVRRTVDAAVTRVNNPQLTALHTGRSPTVAATAMLNK
jgi:UrcA family protein